MQKAFVLTCLNFISPIVDGTMNSLYEDYARTNCFEWQIHLELIAVFGFVRMPL